MTELNHEVWYRFENFRVASFADEFGEISGPGRLVVNLHRYAVERHTPCGVRLECGRLVLHRHRKKFACATIQEAKQCFIARKQRQALILSARLRDAEEAIELVKKMRDEVDGN